MAKRKVETATIAVAAFNEDVKEEDFVLFCSPFVFVKSARVSDDDRGDMTMSDDTTRARINFCRASLSQRVHREKKKSRFSKVLGFLNKPYIYTRGTKKKTNSIWRLYYISIKAEREREKEDEEEIY